MSACRIALGSILFLTLTAISTFAQEFTLTTTSANIISSKASIDRPGLAGNPLAIVATPIGSTTWNSPNAN